MLDMLQTGFSFCPTRHDPARPVEIDCSHVDFWYGEKHALKDVSLTLHKHEVTAFIGPSGCGKSTLLKCLNRMQDDVLGARMTGEIRFQGADIHAREVDPPLLRRRFGWVAQKPNPFPASIRENILYGARIAGLYDSRAEAEALVERHLRAAGLWDEVKDRLDESGLRLSGGQQQRLCIARALSTQADVMLMDEPCSAIDPIAARRVEELIQELQRDLTVVIITHNMEQAARIAQKAAFFHLGRMLEAGDAEAMFTEPRSQEARAYLSGRFG